MFLSQAAYTVSKYLVVDRKGDIEWLMGVWCDTEKVDGRGVELHVPARRPLLQPASHIKPATKSNYSHTHSQLTVKVSHKPPSNSVAV